MLLKGRLPKRKNIIDLTQEELDDIALELNNRPRKRLGHKTTNEVHQEYMLKLQKKENVAVGSRM